MTISIGLKSKKNMQPVLKRIFQEEISPARLEEILTRLETQIEFTTADLGFDRLQGAQRFADILCGYCAFYGLLPVAYRRRPHHLSDELRLANKLHKAAAKLSQKYPDEADAISQAAYRVSTFEAIGGQRPPWNRRDAMAQLAVELDRLFRFYSLARRWSAIGDLVATTFALDDARDGRVHREGSRERWIQQLIRRHKHKVRDISYFSDDSQD